MAQSTEALTLSCIPVLSFYMRSLSQFGCTKCEIIVGFYTSRSSGSMKPLKCTMNKFTCPRNWNNARDERSHWCSSGYVTRIKHAKWFWWMSSGAQIASDMGIPLTTNHHAALRDNSLYVLHRWYWSASVTHLTATQYVPSELRFGLTGKLRMGSLLMERGISVPPVPYIKWLSS